LLSKERGSADGEVIFPGSGRQSVTTMEPGRIMMEKQEMSGILLKAMNHMAGMIQRISDSIGEGTNKAELSEIIRAMSTQMMYISHLMQRGNVFREEVQVLQQRMYLTEKRIERVQMRINSFRETDV